MYVCIYIIYMYVYIYIYVCIYIYNIYIYIYIYIYKASAYEACDRSARLLTPLKHWRGAKKSTLCLIKKASRRVADRPSKTTTFLIFHFL